MKCKKCNNELIKYVEGDTIEYICPLCDETPVTQNENLIELDPNKYVVKILTVKKYEKTMLKAVGQICSCNILEAKRILEITGKKFPPLDALETRNLKKKLDEEKIAYIITPSYKW